MPRDDQCSVTWTNYVGSGSGVELVSACLPVFKTLAGQASCSGVASSGSSSSSDFADLLGCVHALPGAQLALTRAAPLRSVVCMDVNIVEDLPSLQAGSGWGAWSRPTSSTRPARARRSPSTTTSWKPCVRRPSSPGRKPAARRTRRRATAPPATMRRGHPRARRPAGRGSARRPTAASARLPPRQDQPRTTTTTNLADRAG